MPPLRDPLDHSNWVWILGLVLVLTGVLWVVGVWVSYRKSLVRPKFQLSSLDQVQKARYMAQVESVEQAYGKGSITGREAHLALAAIIRACASERTGRNLESATVAEAGDLLPEWPILPEALDWCAASSFPTDVENAEITRGALLARTVIGL